MKNKLKKSLMKVKNSKLIKISKKKLIIFFTVIVVIMWASGFLIGWLWSKGKVGRFPDVNSSTKMLVLAPHPDDEVLISGGLIQRVKKEGGEVKVIYLTIGDSSIGSVVRVDKTLRMNPAEFLDLGERRREESIKATSELDLNTKDLVFLGFPDHGLSEVLERYENDPRGAVVSRSTKLDYVSYSWAYKQGQLYFREELINDLSEIINEFKPSFVITTHPRDTHRDHKAAAELVEIIKEESQGTWDIYLSPVHFRGYPNKGKYIYPPKKLFNESWLSFDLVGSEVQTKKRAIDKYFTQIYSMDRGWFNRFVANNEIFELN